MSAESEDSRDKDGFLRCKECPRIFFTKLAFENHSSNQHNQEIETKLEQLSQTLPVKYPSDCFLCHLSFQSEIEAQQHRSSAHETPLKCSLCINAVHKKLKPFQCQECKRYFGHKHHVQKHISTTHKSVTPLQWQECNKEFGVKSTLEKHINAVLKK